MAAVPHIGRGDQNVTADATHGLYQRYGRQIYAYCLHQLRSREEAEDAVQTTFLNAFRGLQSGTEPHAEQAWLFKIAQHVCYARRSSSSRRLRLEAPNNFELLQDLIPSPQRNGDLELIGLEDALEAMPENQRRAILLREWQGLSYREIADELELSQASVEMLIFRARRALANALEPDAPKKQRKAGRGLSIASLLAAIKSLFTGGAAVKAVAVAVAAAVSAVATEAEHTIVHTVAAPHTVRSAPSLAAQLASRTAGAPRPQRGTRGAAASARGATAMDVALQLNGEVGRAAGVGAQVVQFAPAGGRRPQPTDSPPLAPEQAPAQAAAPAPTAAPPVVQAAPQAAPPPIPAPAAAAPPPAPSAAEPAKAAAGSTSSSAQTSGSAPSGSRPVAAPAPVQAQLTVVIAASSAPASTSGSSSTVSNNNTGGTSDDKQKQKDKATGDNGRVATTPAPTTTTTQPVAPTPTVSTATAPTVQTVPQPVSPAITTTPTSPPVTSGDGKDRWNGKDGSNDNGNGKDKRNGNAPVATTPAAPTPVPPPPAAAPATTTPAAPVIAAPQPTVPQPSDPHGHGSDNGGGHGDNNGGGHGKDK